MTTRATAFQKLSLTNRDACRIVKHRNTVPINSPEGKIGRRLIKYNAVINKDVDDDLVYDRSKLKKPIMPSGVVRKWNATLTGFR
jgi:hypothetical protein